MRLSFLPAERLHEAHTHISINIIFKEKKNSNFCICVENKVHYHHLFKMANH